VSADPLPQTPEDARGSVMTIFPRRHNLGIPGRLTMLALVTALPLVAVGSFAILRTVDDQRDQIQSDVKQMVESFLADVDREISAIWAELQVLATSPNLQSGDFREFDQHAGTNLDGKPVMAARIWPGSTDVE
jgi:hypothetical protein